MNNGNIIIDTMNEENSGVVIKSNYTKRDVHFRESVNPATAGQYVLGVTAADGTTERNVVIRANDTEELMQVLYDMFTQTNTGKTTQTRLTGNVYVTNAQPKVYQVTYQSHISGRQFRVKYSASKTGQFLFTATGEDNYPEQCMLVKATDAISFAEAALDIIEG
jgi:hypothetical protein